MSPKGVIQSLRHVSIVDRNQHRIATGYLAKVLKKADKEEEWFVIHCREGKSNEFFQMIGENSDVLQDWMAKKGYKALWNKDPIIGKAKLLPI